MSDSKRIPHEEFLLDEARKHIKPRNDLMKAQLFDAAGLVRQALDALSELHAASGPAEIGAHGTERLFEARLQAARIMRAAYMTPTPSERGEY